MHISKLGVVSNAPYIAKGIIVETEQLLVDPNGHPYVRMIVSLPLLSITHLTASFA